MSNNYEIKKMSLDLVATMQVGIEYIRSRFAEGRFEEMLPPLQDFIQAFLAIQRALQIGTAETYSRCFFDHTETIQSGLSELVLAYELADWDWAVKALENKVVSGFVLWKTELECCYGPSVAS